jgi:hypothetical protein
MSMSELGFWKEVTSAVTKIVEVVTKPLAVVSDAMSTRLEILLKRKPRLFVNFHPGTPIWCLAHAGTERLMQMMFMADFTQDDPEQTIILIEGYLKRTKPKFHFQEPIDLAPKRLVTPRYNVNFMVTPVIGDEGKNWTGRIYFLDQFHRTYKTRKVEFRWVGAPVPPEKTT